MMINSTILFRQCLKVEMKLLQQFRFDERTLYFRFLTQFAPAYVVRRMTKIVASREPEMDLLPDLCDPERISIDVGVLWGAFANRIQQFSKYCLAIEANPKQFEFLQKNLANKVIHVVNVALSDAAGTAVLRVPVDVTGHGTIENNNDLEAQEYRTYNVERRPLDSFDLGPVGFIKIDVEGHEFAVLKGMKGTLKKYKPNLLIEMVDRYNGGHCHDIFSFLSTIGYQGLVYVDGYLRNIDHYNYEVVESIFNKNRIKRAHNFVFVHEASRSRLEHLVQRVF